ncbi:MAG: serine hydrolase [Eubacteriales bacterium]
MKSAFPFSCISRRQQRPVVCVTALLLALLLLLSCGGQQTLAATTDRSTTAVTIALITTVDPSAEVTAKPPITARPAITTEPTVTTEPAITTNPAVTTEPTVTTNPAVTTEPAVTTDSPTTGNPPETAPITRPVTDEPQTDEPTTQPAPITTPDSDEARYAKQSRNAAYVLLYDLTEGKILYSTGNEQQIYPASTTKLLTLRYALTLVDESTVFTVGDEIDLAPYDSSKAKIRQGEQYTCTDIAAALLLPSGNDAAYTLAAHCGRLLAEDQSLPAADAVARFMEGLNAYAATLGLEGTHFVTPDGYHDEAHVTTMEDILQISLLASSHPLLKSVMGMPTYKVTDLVSGRTQTWTNTNLLLQSDNQSYYPYATGGKTGFHTPAGACLIATARKDGRELMVLIFKCTDKNSRFTDAKNFLELGFSLQGPA